MSQIVRQSELFAGNDWTVLYQAFSQVNFNAYDFNSIREAMTTYIQINYPEEFNDWIASSEFVALLDLLAYLGQSLAFRMDVNARENFIDIARRQESVLRLARFLSYTPRRNLAATGLVKIVSVRTTDNITDSYGNDLGGKTINWNDTSNSQWQDQWFNVLKAVFVNTNPFGTPLQQGTIENIPTQLYRLNNTPTNAGSFPFSANIDGNSLPFELVNMNFDSKSGFFEMDPNLLSPFQICYKNDSNGNDSKDTGFFAMFKQGTLQKSDYSISSPVSNLTITLPANNINNSDVWVQTVNDAGYTVSNGAWTKVGYVPTDDMSKVIVTTDNITYNSVDSDIRNIFQAVSLANDQVMLRFGDGLYGTAPTGNIRCWYRVSDNGTFTVRPEAIRNVPMSFTYTNSTGGSQTFTITFSLQENVDNSAPSEDLDDIRRRATNVYNTQGRMVSGADYNTLPATNNVALKVKAVNRIYSGQSRYLDLNDPTGTYQSTNVFADDGIIYTDSYSGYKEIASSLNYASSNLTTNFFEPMIQETYVRDLIMNEWLTKTNYNFTFSTPIYWQQATSANFSSTGLFSTDAAGTSPVQIGSNSTSGSVQSNMLPNSLVKFRLADGSTTWATIASIDALGSTHVTTVSTDSSKTIGPIKLSQNIPSGSAAIKIIPCFRNTLDTNEINSIVSAFSAKRTFAVGFDYNLQEWYVVDGLKINNGDYDYTTKGSNKDSSWLIKCEYSTLYWRIYTRGKVYVFESLQDVKFFFVDTYKSVDPQTGRLGNDEIKVLKYNFSSTSSSSQSGTPTVYTPTVKPSDIPFSISGTYSYSDGSIEPNRVMITFSDSNYDGQPDDPEAFIEVMDKTTANPSNPADVLVFHVRYQDSNGYDAWKIDDSVTIMSAAPNSTPTSTIYVPGTSMDNGTFYVPSTDSVDNHIVNIGTESLSFQWRHFAPSDHRIDPSVTNIIDVFVLTNAYYNNMISWLNAGMDPLSIPSQPSEADLQTAYLDLENYKMFSDEMVWRPVKFKMIGGANADPELKFALKIIKLPDTLVSDGEIKTNVIQAVQYYFDVSRWDFGETFYASELIAFIHQQLIEGIGSVVLVPQSGDQSFGNLFQITSLPDELFFCTLQVSDIQIIPAMTASNLRIS